MSVSQFGTIYHIPVCQFSQRLEILPKLKGRSADIDFKVVDITIIPRPEWLLLEKSRGSTALPARGGGYVGEVRGRIRNERLHLCNESRCREKRKFHDDLLAQYRVFNDFLLEHSPEGTFLLADFGWVEAVYTPFFMRFGF